MKEIKFGIVIHVVIIYVEDVGDIYWGMLRNELIYVILSNIFDIMLCYVI